MVNLNGFTLNLDGIEDYLCAVKIRGVMDGNRHYAFIFHVDEYKFVVDEWPPFNETVRYDLSIYKDVSSYEDYESEWLDIHYKNNVDADYIIGLLTKFKEHEAFLKSLETVVH